MKTLVLLTLLTVSVVAVGGCHSWRHHNFTDGYSSR